MGHMGTHAASVALYPNLAYKPDVDFAPIGLVAGTPVLILARKDFPPANLKDFVTYVKTNVDKLNMAHAGVGSVSFTTCLLLNSILAVKPTSIPFNGTGPALTALISGQVDFMCDQIVNVVQQVQAVQIKAHAIGTAEGKPALPHGPASKEAGLPEFPQQDLNALVAPQSRLSPHEGLSPCASTMACWNGSLPTVRRSPTAPAPARSRFSATSCASTSLMASRSPPPRSCI